MSTERILIHGTTAARMATTPALGQIGSDDDTGQVILGDGETPGGIPMARADALDAKLSTPEDGAAGQVLGRTEDNSIAWLNSGFRRNFLVNSDWSINQEGIDVRVDHTGAG